MKKIVVLALSLLLFTSCQITEEITFQEDGSGTYNLKIDMGQMLAMTKEMNKNKDSLQPEKKPEKKDTIMKFSDIFKKNKDSIKRLTKEERELLAALKDAYIQINMDEAKSQMLMQYVVPFKKTEDLNNINEKLQKLNSLNKKKQKGANDFEKLFNNEKVSYVFNKRTFRRIVTPETNKKKDSVQDQGFKKMLDAFQFRMVYHFPYKIKSVSYKDALIKADGKTLIIEVPMDKLAENPKLLDFEVKFD